MLQKIDTSYFNGRGAIQILYPGLAVSGSDTGISSIGRIDHAEVHGSGTIPMHPHINDEILSYFRSGKGIHRDSEGYEEIIGKEKLMLMKAGRFFQHEETMSDEGEALEGLQIFIRPGQKDLKPEVVFHQLDQLHCENQWRLLGSPGTKSPFQFSSQTWIYDMKLLAGSNASLPVSPVNGATSLLYVFKGSVSINDNIILTKRESLVIGDESVSITATSDAELVLFITDEQSEIFKGGMFSGNKIASK